MTGGPSQDYEFNDPDIDGEGSIYEGRFFAQTFTPQQSHYITSVKLLLNRLNWPGFVTVSIKNTSSGLPVGPNLCVGETDGDTLPVLPSYEWRQINFSPGYPLSLGVMYAIVVRLTGEGTFADKVEWNGFVHGSTYPRGTWCSSLDYGVTWESLPSYDFAFYERGYGIAETGVTDYVMGIINRWGTKHYSTELILGGLGEKWTPLEISAQPEPLTNVEFISPELPKGETKIVWKQDENGIWKPYKLMPDGTTQEIKI